MILCAIAAMAKNRVIGRANQLPWHIPEDLKFFKETTLNKVIIMGRKTFESLGKPLPKRTNIVISRQPNYSAVGARVFASLESALEFLNSEVGAQDEVFVIGGGEIYTLALQKIQRIYLTEIDDEFEGDALFPVFRVPEDFKLVSKRDSVFEGLEFSFCTYER